MDGNKSGIVESLPGDQEGSVRGIPSISPETLSFPGVVWRQVLVGTENRVPRGRFSGQEDVRGRCESPKRSEGRVDGWEGMIKGGNTETTTTREKWNRRSH